MRIFIDTEFPDLVDLDLISIGLVAEDGRELYGERSDFDRAKCNDFVREFVLPQLGELPDRLMPRDQLRDEVGTRLAQYKHQQPCICYDFFGDFALLRELLDGKVARWLNSQNVFRKIDASEKRRFWAKTGFQDHHALNDAHANWCAFRISICLGTDQASYPTWWLRSKGD